MSERRWGALVVLERETALGEYAATGVEIDALLSVEMLEQIFHPNTRLHDGAAIIRGERILAAACVLPLTETLGGGAILGTRHRAAVGITETTDAIVVVVSEETGQISIANKGRLVRNLDEAKLRKVLQILYRPEELQRVLGSGPPTGSDGPPSTNGTAGGDGQGTTSGSGGALAPISHLFGRVFSRLGARPERIQ
jgi:diadenylate cyclase